MRGALTLAATGLLSLTAWGAAPPVAPADEDRAPAGSRTIPLPEVTVAAPEPRYVAPTLRDRIGRIWAPVLINGQGPFRLVLDTGASRSAVTTKVAESLGIPIEESSRVTMHGVTGSAMAATIRADRLEVGDLLVERPQLLIVEDAFGGAEGVLATEGLKDKRITIEFRRDRIEIARSRRQPAPAGFATIPVQLAQARVITSDARVGPLGVKAIIDTGAQQTIGNLALRDRLLALRGTAPGREQDVIGMTGDVQSGPNAPVPSIGLGEIQINNADITFVDLHIFRHWGYVDEPVLMIGMDVLGLLDTLIIDYRRRELQVRTRRGAP
ncbi:MAG: retroviral-like aspartic protease family protein [Steroidobacteraceae bacterium]|jgi:predicted aspartyl protease|nr:retroviral-like aspartic protease family protein [Steroidobacteraceae bacterium]